LVHNLNDMEENTSRNCHCGGQTKVYLIRKLRDGNTIKTYHFCVDCKSRFVDTWVSEIANAKSVSIFDINIKNMENQKFIAPDLK